MLLHKKHLKGKLEPNEKDNLWEKTGSGNRDGRETSLSTAFFLKPLFQYFYRQICMAFLPFFSNSFVEI